MLQKMVQKLSLGWLLLFLAFPATAFSDYYKWTDKAGKTHFTDDYYSIPQEYQDQVEKRKSASPIEKKEKPKKAETPEIPAVIIEEEEMKPPAKDPQKGKDAKISILDKVVPIAGSEGNMVFPGRIKNNSKDTLHSMEIVFTVEDREGNALETAKSAVKGESEGTLKGGEVGTFEVKTAIPFNTIVIYKYNVQWKGFVN